MATIDDFAKLDIRIGTIVNAERITGTDKLLRLDVDFGPKSSAPADGMPDRPQAGRANGRDIRQIISGIAEHVPPEELIGLQCPFIVNLEPRTIRGYESNGMILAVGGGDIFSLLMPCGNVPPGSRVR